MKVRLRETRHLSLSFPQKSPFWLVECATPRYRVGFNDDAPSEAQAYLQVAGSLKKQTPGGAPGVDTPMRKLEWRKRKASKIVVESNSEQCNPAWWDKRGYLYQGGGFHNRKP